MRFQLFCGAKIATWTEWVRLGLENLLAIPLKSWDISKRFDFVVFRRKKQHQIALGGVMRTLRWWHIACRFARLRPQSRPSVLPRISSLFIFDATAPELRSPRLTLATTTTGGLGT
jgi:hypothetical protein